MEPVLSEKSLPVIKIYHDIYRNIYQAISRIPLSTLKNSSQQQHHSADDQQVSHPHLNVLLVEDDECLQTAVARVLREFDAKPEVVWTATGEEALAQIDDHKFDLIIADFTLAGMKNGLHVWEVCRKRFPETPFIMISGLPVDSFLHLTGLTGERPKFLPKPFFAHELRDMVKESLHLPSFTSDPKQT